MSENNKERELKDEVIDVEVIETDSEKESILNKTKNTASEIVKKAYNNRGKIAFGAGAVFAGILACTLNSKNSVDDYSNDYDIDDEQKDEMINN